MHRKQWSYGQSRRSSGLKRFSIPVPEPDEKNKNVGDGKKSFIPRPTVFTRSSSAEREGYQNSARSTQKFARSISSENIGSENPKSDYRSRGTENAFTPKHVLKPHGSRSTVSVQRSGRKDTRPLTDRAYQMTALAKVEEYLISKEIITPGTSLSNNMTLKLFVSIMNSLLSVCFPKDQLTLSNYSELIPFLMRKLKYPGNITRSWLVTANSSHTWPNVLGLLSWLVDLINIPSSNLKHLSWEDGEGLLDCEQSKSLFEFTKKRYIEWSERDDMPFSTEEDNIFFDDLVATTIQSLEDNLEKVEEDVQVLKNLKSDTESPEECSAEQKFKTLKTDLEKKKSAINNLNEKLKTKELGIEKDKSEMESLSIKNKNLKESIKDQDCSDSFNADIIPNLQSDKVSLEKIIRLKDTNITDINHECYSTDLAIARRQGKMDEIRLQREAILQKCTSQYINAEELQLSLNYGNKNNSRIVAEYFENIKKARVSVENILEKYKEAENSWKAKKNEAEDKTKFCKSGVSSNQIELQQLDLELAEIKKESSGLESHIQKIEEELFELKQKYISLDHDLKVCISHISISQEELKDEDESFAEAQAKYNRILKRMGEVLLNHTKKMYEDIFKSRNP